MILTAEIANLLRPPKLQCGVLKNFCKKSDFRTLATNVACHEASVTQFLQVKLTGAPASTVTFLPGKTQNSVAAGE
eukprot:COSAG01_NODE_2425_length_7679_cov_96.031221_8_plen_76_part_00